MDLFGNRLVPSQVLHFLGYAFEKSQALQKYDFYMEVVQKLKFPNNSNMSDSTRA